MILSKATAIANRVLHELAPHCARIQIAVRTAQALCGAIIDTAPKQ